MVTEKKSLTDRWEKVKLKIYYLKLAFYCSINLRKNELKKVALNHACNVITLC